MGSKYIELQLLRTYSHRLICQKTASEEWKDWQGLTQDPTEAYVDNLINIRGPVIIVKPQCGSVYVANIKTITLSQKKVKTAPAIVVGEDSTLLL